MQPLWAPAAPVDLGDLGRPGVAGGPRRTPRREFDEVGRLAGQAQKNLENLRAIGGRVHKKLYDGLTGGLTIPLRPG